MTDSETRDLTSYIGELYAALRGGTTVPPLSPCDATLTIYEAYIISLGVLEKRKADGERVTGKKIGVTSKVVQDMLGVDQPDFGFLTDRMRTSETVDMEAHGLIQPRAEAEVAFILKHALAGLGVTEADVLDATESVAPCFKIVDSRIDHWKIGIIDTVADNASCGVFTLGTARLNPRGLDLPGLRVTMRKNGEFLSEGLGSAVQGSPLTAVAWLANTLGRHGMTLDPGDVIHSGSLVPLEPVQAGDSFEMELQGVGNCAVRFV